MIHTTVRLTEDEKKLLDENYMSLTKFVRMNLKKYKESKRTAKVSEIPTNSMEAT